MGIKFNPLIFGGLDLSSGGSGPAGAVEWKSPVATESALPTIGNSPGDARVALDTDKIYVWDDASSKWIDSKLTTALFGATPNAAGLTVSSVTVGDITRATINLEPANATNPGAVSTTTQTFAGSKTFLNQIQTDGGIDVTATVGTDVLNIGVTNANTVNIGNNLASVNIDGTVNIDYTPAVPANWAPAPNDVIEAIDQLADRFVEQDEVTNEPTGFVNRTSSELVFTDGGLIPRNFEIKVKAPATSFTFYVKGKKFTKSTTESIQISADLGDHYIYYDNNGVLQETIDPDEIKIIIQERAFVAVVYWNNETNSHTYFADERHGLTMDGVTHAYLHTVFGSRYLSGFGLDNFNLLAPSFQADIGSFRDEDILHQVTTQTDEIPILYRFGANDGWRKKAADTYPVIYQGSTADYPAGIIRLPYNEYTEAVWQLTEIDNNKYVLVHFFATNDIDNPIVGIQGTAPHESISDAKNAANTEITQLSGLPFTEFVPIGSVVFQSSVVSKASPTYSDIQLIDGANYIDFRGTQLYTPAGTATTHGLLSGLGNDDHLQYLLADGTRTMGGALDMGTHQINNVVDPTSAQDAATKNYVDGKVADSITDGVTTIAPSQNAVFDALALKQDTGDYIIELTGEVTASGPGSVAATIAANAVTNAKMAQMPALTLKGNNTGLASDPLDLTVSDVQSLLSITPSYSGDIPRTTFTAIDNTVSPLPITDLVFSNATVRAFDVILSVVRGVTYAEYSLKGIQKGSSWEMSQDYIGDDTGLVFSVTSVGQIEYTSTSTGTNADIIFRAITV